MTNEAPERIWVSETDLGERWWQEEDYEPATRYVRADHLKAAVAAAYEDAASVVSILPENGNAGPPQDATDRLLDAQRRTDARAIRARTDADALAALDRVKREARRAAIREAAEVCVGKRPVKISSGYTEGYDKALGSAACSILALLDKEGK